MLRGGSEEDQTDTIIVKAGKIDRLLAYVIGTVAAFWTIERVAGF